MIKRNVWKAVTDPLEYFEDYRGKISDIFFKKNINHVAIIHSEPNIMRGNHYHKETTQHMLMTRGSLEYWYKSLEGDSETKMFVAKVGDLVTTPPNEIHTLIIREDGNEFVVFSEGVRGGSDYESDTYRVECFVPADKIP